MGEPADACPIFKWGQRSGKVVVTVFVPCVDESRVQVKLEAQAVRFRAEHVAVLAGGQEVRRLYALPLQLYGEIDEDESRSFLRHDHVRLELVKRKPTLWPTLQAPHVPRNPNERPDFDHLVADNQHNRK